jgi:hypothetical protein
MIKRGPLSPLLLLLHLLKHFTTLSLPSLDMDPYEHASSGWIPNDDQLNDVDELEKLEQDLMPQPDDYYGILNISKTVRTFFRPKAALTTN